MNPTLSLNIESQKKSGKSQYPLKKKRIVIGTSSSADLRLEDEDISPIHAIFEVDSAGNITLYDMASYTGTKVRGENIIQATLKKGDSFQIGAHIFSIKEVEEELKLARAANPYDNQPLSELTEELVDIFDYRDESKLSLQVVMFYCDTIADIRHFQNKQSITLGPNPKNEFDVPVILGGVPKDHYELISFSSSHVLKLHPKMEGVLNLNGQLVSLKDFLRDTTDSKTVNLTESDFAKIDFGDMTFFVNFSPTPPRLKPQKIGSKDPFFFRIWLMSLVTTVMVILGVSNVTVTPKLEIEEIPDRIATIIYEPKILPPKPKPQPVVEAPKVEHDVKKVELKEPPQPKKIVLKPKPISEPKPIKATEIAQEAKTKNIPKILPKVAKKDLPPKVAANKGGNEGAGERARGAEGQRGNQNAPKASTHQMKALRPGTAPENAPAVARSGKSQVQDLGVVDVFKGAAGSLDKILAGGKGASGAADKLQGYGGFTTRGNGGLGEAGSGGGGGGKSMGLGGLSDKGAGGGRRGVGLGALGSGGNIIGGKGRLIIAGGAGAPEAIVMGGIDSDLIAQIINQHRDEIRYCYEKEINADNPNLEGRVNVRWVIGSSGAVSSAGVVSSSIKNANVEGCVVGVIKRIAFPPVKGGGIAEVTYPFVFRPVNR